jgi:cytochrome c oxidase assembly factor CtaG
VILSDKLPILLHPGQPVPAGDIWSLWSWDPTVLVGCAALVVCYVWLLRGWLSARFYLFFAGVLVLLLALVSPLDALADHYLFSAHMLQHLLLILVVPPLLLLGTPASLFTGILRNPAVARLERVLRQPVIAWTLGIGTLYVWHAPVLYNAALADEQVHVLQHLCFLVTATIFWWLILSPVESSRTSLLVAVPYLLAAAMANSLLGIYFSFASPGLYPAYLNPGGDPGVLAIVRTGWSLSAAADQQLGGLMMWVPGGLVFLAAVFGVLARWYSSGDTDEFSDEMRSA